MTQELQDIVVISPKWLAFSLSHFFKELKDKMFAQVKREEKKEKKKRKETKKKERKQTKRFFSSKKIKEKRKENQKKR